jgi:hypothetical protein
MQTHPKLRPDGHARWAGASRFEDPEIERRSWAVRQAPTGFRPGLPPAAWVGAAWATIGLALLVAVLAGLVTVLFVARGAAIAHGAG